MTHISECVRPFVHWEFSVHLSECCIFLDTVAFFSSDIAKGELGKRETGKRLFLNDGEKSRVEILKLNYFIIFTCRIARKRYKSFTVYVHSF